MGHVTGVPPSSFFNKPLSKVSTPDAGLYPSPSSPPTAPIHLINTRQPSNNQITNNQLVTPPLTPENTLVIPHPQKSFAFANSVFPEQAPMVSKYAVPFQICSGFAWDAFVLSLPNYPKTLYVDGKCMQPANLRERRALSLRVVLQFVEYSSQRGGTLRTRRRATRVFGSDHRTPQDIQGIG